MSHDANVIIYYIFEMKKKKAGKNILINCKLMIFILFVLIPRGKDNHEKCLVFAFYENRIKHTNILSPFSTRPRGCWNIKHVNTASYQNRK